MSKNWLGRKWLKALWLGCSIISFCGTAHAQGVPEFSLSLRGNPQVFSTGGTTVDGGFNTGSVQTVGPLTRSINLLSSGTSSSGSYNYNISAELGHLKGSALAMGRATGSTANRGSGAGTLTLNMSDTITSNGVGDFQITMTLRSRVVHTPLDGDCTNSSFTNNVRAVLTAPTALQLIRTCSSDASVTVQTAQASVHSSGPGMIIPLQGFLQLIASATAVGTTRAFLVYVFT